MGGEPGIGAEHGVVVPVRTDPSGVTGPTRRQAATAQWRRSSHGLYVPADVELTPEQRIVEAGVLACEYGAVTGWSALRWMGGAWFEGLTSGGHLPLPVRLATGKHRMRQQPGLTVCEERFDPAECLVVDGVVVTNAVRSLCFEVRYARFPWAAVAAVDMAAFHDLVSVAELTAYVMAHPSYTGIEQGRDVLPCADENAWSPTEVAMRLSWETEAYLPRPLTNRPVFDLDGQHVATPDLIDPEVGVYGEYDSTLHLTASRRSIDLRREAALRAVGLEGVTMVAADLADRSHFVARLRAAYDRAHGRPASNRRWTLERPAWWPPTFTVEQRRALPPHLAATWLRHRAG